GGVDDEAPEIVAARDLGQAGDADDLEAGRHRLARGGEPRRDAAREQEPAGAGGGAASEEKPKVLGRVDVEADPGQIEDDGDEPPGARRFQVIRERGLAEL